MAGRPRGLSAAEDRRKALEILDAAMVAGARAREVAALLGIWLSTLQRWRRQFAADGPGVDRRKGSHRLVSHRLSEEERQRILLACNEPDIRWHPAHEPAMSSGAGWVMAASTAE